MKPSDFKYLLPNQEIEFADEITGDEILRIKVKLEEQEGEAPDPASFIDHEWIETEADRYKLKVINKTQNPLYVNVENAE